MGRSRDISGDARHGSRAGGYSARPGGGVRRGIALAALLAAVTTISGCLGSGDRVTGTSGVANGSGVGGDGFGDVRIDPALVGRWSRTITFEDDFGSLISNQLIWEFKADGGASRIIITSNLSQGLIGTEVVPAIWRVEGRAVVITFLTPDTGVLRFQYAVRNNVLILGPFELERLI